MGQEQDTVAPLLLGVDETARLLGVSARLVWKMDLNGTLGPLPVRLGRRTLWKREEIAAWVAANCPNRAQWFDLQKTRGRGR